MMDVLDFAKKVAKKCIGVEGVEPKDLYGAVLYGKLFEKVCGPVIEEAPLFPPLYATSDYIDALLDFISCNFLDLDISTRITGRDVVNGNDQVVMELLFLFDRLHTCLYGEQQKKPVKEPSKTKPDLIRLKSKSVLYSPRTQAFRSKSQNGRVIKRPTAVPRTKENTTRVQRNTEIGFQQPTTSAELDRAIHKIRMNSVVDKHLKEVQSTVRTLPKQQPTPSHNATNRRCSSAVDKRHELLAVKRAKLVLENQRRKAMQTEIGMRKAAREDKLKKLGNAMAQEDLRTQRKQRFYEGLTSTSREAEADLRDRLGAISSKATDEGILRKLERLEKLSRR